MAGWRPVGRLVGLAGAVARRLSWGTMGPSCIPGGSVRCRVRRWDAGDGTCRGGGRQALTGTRRGSRCFGRCRCHCGVRGGLRLAAYWSSRLASGVGGGCSGLTGAVSQVDVSSGAPGVVATKTSGRS